MAALFTQDALQAWQGASEGGTAFRSSKPSRKGYAVEFASTWLISLFRCMQSATTYARYRNGVARSAVSPSVTMPREIGDYVKAVPQRGAKTEVKFYCNSMMSLRQPDDDETNSILTGTASRLGEREAENELLHKLDI